MQILIACIGNIFLGDDGFGTEVARRLADRSLPPGVIVKDFGIRGLDLTYTLLDHHDLVILVDACPRGGEPGTVYLLEPDPVEATPFSGLETHALNPMSVLRTVKSMGGDPGRILIVGCEPAQIESEDGGIGLSPAVELVVEEAILLIEATISKAVQSNEVQV